MISLFSLSLFYHRLSLNLHHCFYPLHPFSFSIYFSLSSQYYLLVFSYQSVHPPFSGSFPRQSYEPKRNREVSFEVKGMTGVNQPLSSLNHLSEFLSQLLFPHSLTQTRVSPLLLRAIRHTLNHSHICTLLFLSPYLLPSFFISVVYFFSEHNHSLSPSIS